MRVYKTTKGQWFGTQAEARRNSPRQWVEVIVPTTKTELLSWLNVNCAKTETAAAGVQVSSPDLISPQAESWVAWALDKLQSGRYDDAEKILREGLKIQRGKN